MNTTTVVGNVTRDPELRFTPTGQAVATFGLAVNRRWRNRQTQEWEESTSFFDVVCWREMAENVANSLAKGARVIVTGRLDQRSWQTDSGDTRSRVEIVADEVGPSLRWATAEVTRIERAGPSAAGVPQLRRGALLGPPANPLAPLRAAPVHDRGEGLRTMSGSANTSRHLRSIRAPTDRQPAADTSGFRPQSFHSGFRPDSSTQGINDDLLSN